MQHGATIAFGACLLKWTGISLEQSVNLHQQLIGKCLEGDRNAFYQVYNLYAKAMYNVCYRILRDEDDASDALQEAFISAFNHLHYYRGEASFGGWLKRIVVNKAINFTRKKRWEPLDEEFDLAEEQIINDDYDGLTVDRVKKAIEELPDGYRTVLSLYLIEGYDHQEIGEILGIGESTSKSQLNRAKKKLRETLTQKI